MPIRNVDVGHRGTRFMLSIKNSPKSLEESSGSTVSTCPMTESNTSHGPSILRIFRREIQSYTLDFRRQRQSDMLEDGYSNDNEKGNMVLDSRRDVFYWEDESVPARLLKNAPTADLYLNCTILHIHIAGFTAWSSAREPPQIIVLLESIYRGFDDIALKHGVFKVEINRERYVTVVGLPEPRENHAVVMAQFATDCMHFFQEMSHKLEVSFGPDTSDLGLRMGLHSGQVTAGVLRGQLQLFGETANTAAKLRNTSKKSRIHVSNTAADLMQTSGLGEWLKPRSEKIPCRMRGDMQTFWLLPKPEEQIMFPILENSDSHELDSVAELDITDLEEEISTAEVPSLSKKQRLVEWNVDVMVSLLQQIVAVRSPVTIVQPNLGDLEMSIGQESSTVLEEFKEIVCLPNSIKNFQSKREPNSIELSQSVVSQLRDFISKVAYMYHDNAFHNFEHASHVAASVKKMLTRIVELDNSQQNSGDDGGTSSSINLDPLTQFTVVFSSLIHDADHRGVPNSQLIKEKSHMVSMYKEKSVAEQNSVDLVWSLLMIPDYTDLRRCIYTNEDELRYFRQLVVNIVMATDICDKDLGALRKNRWDQVFVEGQEPLSSLPSQPHIYSSQVAFRKGFIVLEYLIQASDVSHTMQHWKIYRQWNERFFMECYGAYKEGRADQDPSEGWYKGEISFFDFYVIPLTKKLEKCRVFGVSSHEYLHYALGNRERWKFKGEAIVQHYLSKWKALQLKNQQGGKNVDMDPELISMQKIIEEISKSTRANRQRLSMRKDLSKCTLELFDEP